MIGVEVKKQIKLTKSRKTRKFRVSNAVKKYSTRPRLVVFRSHKHISAQVIDDANGVTIASAGTLDKDLRSSIAYGGNCDAAAKIGEAIAKKAVAAGVVHVAFDRRGYKYHGRVKSLADAARDNGLDIGGKGESE
jgi:large subunit ribosomal protein L18